MLHRFLFLYFRNLNIWRNHWSCFYFKCILFFFWSCFFLNLLDFFGCWDNLFSNWLWSWLEIFFIKIKFWCFNFDSFFFFLRFCFFFYFLNRSSNFFSFNRFLGSFLLVWVVILDNVAQWCKWILILNVLVFNQIKSLLNSKVTCRLSYFLG